MSDRIIPFGPNPRDTATLLLAAAEELGVGQESVRTVEGGFRVPEEVAAKAEEKPEPEPQPEPQPEQHEESPKVEPEHEAAPKKQATKRSPKK
jgi:outer membrane biosynthesis protein TonB